MKKRLFAILLALALVVSLMPLSALAAEGCTITIQPVVVEGDGWDRVDSDALSEVLKTKSAEFENGVWSWAPSDTKAEQYIVYSPSGYPVVLNLIYPSKLWDYDTDKLEFVGIGKGQAQQTTETVDTNNEEAFEGKEFNVTGPSTNRFIYFFRLKDTESEEPITYPVVYSWRNLPKDADFRFLLLNTMKRMSK